MKILNRYTNACIWESDHATMKETVEAAVAASADLTYADLTYANLTYANLTSANLTYADLTYANLTSANLTYADLTYAKGLTDETNIGTETWGVYKSEVVPQLLRAGGRALADLLKAGAWECNSWENCPAAFAFGVHTIESIPALYRPRVQQFIQYFDAKMLPREIIEKAIAKEVL